MLIMIFSMYYVLLIYYLVQMNSVFCDEVVKYIVYSKNVLELGYLRY